MSSWNAMTYDGKDNILRVVRHEAERFYALAERPEAWEAPTACRQWQVRDLVGHIVDTTEAYFVAFDTARSHGPAEPAYGLPGMAKRANERALALRSVPQDELIERGRTDLAKMMEMFDALGPDEWGDLLVPHFYMGPLPVFFYPAFQLMDYAVHSWDIRQGIGDAHGLSGDAADLLVPFMFVLWQYTAVTAKSGACEVGIRITSGPNAGDTRISATPDGMTYEPAEVSKLQTVIEFDPASFVLTAFGRCNAGTIRGDVATADRFLNLFFRI
jgi:uncharacterized protein (TIGR03083 family)